MKLFPLINELIILSVIIFSFAGCSKSAELPSVTTSGIEHFYIKSASGDGIVTDEGGATVIERGVCWGTSAGPTVNDNRYVNGHGPGSFEFYLEGLSANTLYYVRAYARNKAGIGYGNQVLFRTLPPSVPFLRTNPVFPLSTTTAVSGAKWIDDNGSAINLKGVCWSRAADPTISDQRTNDGSGTGDFISNMSDLLPGTTYYIRAYAINDAGIGYGDQLTFTTMTTLTDIDGNIYRGVTLGQQAWMAENLKTTRYQNGDLIGTTIPATLNTGTGSFSGYQWAYNGTEDSVSVYGRLYNWYAATDSRRLCPAGWHLPSENEWSELMAFLGGSDYIGTIIKEAGSVHWKGFNAWTTNSSNFTALHGGFRESGGSFDMTGYGAYWWTTGDIDSLKAAGRSLVYNNMVLDSFSKSQGLSVRCVKD